MDEPSNLRGPGRKLVAPWNALQEFLAQEASAGFLLMGAAVLAIFIVNSPGRELYHHALGLHLGGLVGPLRLDASVLEWINDGLMAVFFLLVSLEIKRELAIGELSGGGRLALPAVAAMGGMALPALIYLGFTLKTPEWRGWAIPSATDIAFSLGVLSLLGSRVAPWLKSFLAALAILDDLGAIVVIAVFYGADLSWGLLGLAAVAAGGLVLLNRIGCRRVSLYLLVGLVLWACLWHSGLHPTLAGVATGLAVPADGREGGRSPLARLEHRLHPWVTYGILPLFAFGNAGLDLAGFEPHSFGHPVVVGVALGLFAGKQLGVLGASALWLRLSRQHLPEGVTWRAFHGLSVLTGIGFTMSLFIGGLAFPDSTGSEWVRLGVVTGSVVSAVAGSLILRSGARG